MCTKSWADILARSICRLTAVTVSKAKKPGLHADGAGLYLKVTEDGTKSWVFRFMMQGRARAMGLGSLHTVSLAQARTYATECRKMILDGFDPIDEREARRSKVRTTALLDAVKATTFSDCVTGYIEAHRHGWGKFCTVSSPRHGNNVVKIRNANKAT